MIIENGYNTYEIENLTFHFYEDYYYPSVSFNFRVVHSCEYLYKTYFEDITITIEPNLPYTMLLKEILKKCEEIIETLD